MCLILFACDAHPDYRLVLAANRDEFYARPTAPAQYWEDAPAVLAGRDLQAMGTWLGVTRAGRFAALTNFRGPATPPVAPRSRGALVSDYLTGTAAPAAYLAMVAGDDARYQGYNLLVGDAQGVHYHSNRAAQPPRRVASGLHGISNHLLDTAWPKVVQGKARLQRLLHEDRVDEQTLFALLADEATAADATLPSTGVPPEFERALSPLFVRTAEYGTRCSTLLWIDRAGRLSFAERSHEAGSAGATRRFEFQLPPG